MDMLIDAHGEPVDPNSIRGRLTIDKQRDIDARMAAWFSTSSEQYSSEDIRTMQGGA